MWFTKSLLKIKGRFFEDPFYQKASNFNALCLSVMIKSHAIFFIKVSALNNLSVNTVFIHVLFEALLLCISIFSSLFIYYLVFLRTWKSKTSSLLFGVILICGHMAHVEVNSLLASYLLVACTLAWIKI